MTLINLSDFVSFKLMFDSQTNKITTDFNEAPSFSTRKLFEMADVIYDKEWLKEQKENQELYFMYRNFTRKEDKKKFEEHSIRYDITIIPPKMLGKEFIKTAGHFHPNVKNNLSYPEAYEVMHGKGLYLLQNESKSKESIEVTIIPAEAGDQILIPPNYGHITINPLKDKPLVMNNLVSSKFDSLYENIKKKKGAAYLYHSNDVWFKNSTYKQKLIVREKLPTKLTEKPFYIAFLEDPNFWIFLNEPWKMNWI